MHDPTANGAGEHPAADLAALLARFEAQQRRLDELERRQFELEADRAALRATVDAQADRLAKQEAARTAAHERDDRTGGARPGSSRRALLAQTAAALAGIGLATGAARDASAQTEPGKSGQANGGPILIAQLNQATPTGAAYNGSTILTNTSGTLPVHSLFNAANYASGSVPPDAPPAITASLVGSTTYPNASVSTQYHVGVYGYAPASIGVVAEARWPVWLPAQNFPQKYGVAGLDTPPDTDTGGNLSPNGTLLYQGFRSAGTGLNGPDVLWLRTYAGGSALAPATGVWGRLATGTMAGVLTPLNPTRVLDTRPAAENGSGPIGFDAAGNQIAAGQLADGSTVTYRVGGKGFSGFGGFIFPVDVRGLLFNITLVQGGPSGGYATVFPADQTAPNASSVNPSGATGITANFGFTGLGPNGTFSVKSVGAARHILVDVTGYFV